MALICMNYINTTTLIGARWNLFVIFVFVSFDFHANCFHIFVYTHHIYVCAHFFSLSFGFNLFVWLSKNTGRMLFFYVCSKMILWKMQVTKTELFNRPTSISISLKLPIPTDTKQIFSFSFFSHSYYTSSTFDCCYCYLCWTIMEQLFPLFHPVHFFFEKKKKK